MRPDIMMVDLTTNHLSDNKSSAPKERTPDREQTNMIGPKKVKVLEAEYVADTEYDDKHKAKI